MPNFRNVPPIRRSRRLSNRPPPVDPEYEDYDLDQLQLLYPGEAVPHSASIEIATQYTTATPADISPAVGTSSDEGVDVEAAAFVPRSSHSRRRKEGHIPRPPNAFMLFRSHLWAERKIPERDHRQISRIAGNVWNKMSPEQKGPFQERAVQEKERHAQLYPDYKYAPVYKTKAGKKRTRRDADVDKTRCKRLADLLCQGVEGRDLEQVASKIDEEAEDSNAGPDRVQHSRRAMHRAHSPYSYTTRQRAGPSRSRDIAMKQPKSIPFDVARSPAPEPTSPVVKPEVVATPQFSYPPLPEELAPRSYVATADIPPLNLSGDANQLASLELFQTVGDSYYHPPEMLPALGGLKPDASSLVSSMLEHEEFLLTAGMSPAESLSSPSSSSSTVSPPMASGFDLKAEPDTYGNACATLFNNPWDPASSSTPNYSMLLNLDQYGDGEVSPTTPCYPQYIPDDVLSKLFLNDDFTT
ncbi:hypothetical protein BC835DRAFT_1304090 [Cytidiella melzeri]|nr:hypothetical protein BC835DRAFT_1304090 [Cytidiella melzeri]